MTFFACLINVAGCGVGVGSAPPCSEATYSSVSRIQTAVIQLRDSGESEASQRLFLAEACSDGTVPDGIFATFERCQLCMDQIVQNAYH